MRERFDKCCGVARSEVPGSRLGLAPADLSQRRPGDAD